MSAEVAVRRVGRLVRPGNCDSGLFPDRRIASLLAPETAHFKKLTAIIPCTGFAVKQSDTWPCACTLVRLLTRVVLSSTTEEPSHEPTTV